MTHRCPTCMANVSDHLGALCPECGASLREGYDDEPGAVFGWDEPVPVTFNDYTPEPPDELWDAVPRCKCSHGPSNHSRGRGECWNTSCGCQSYLPKEGAA